MVCFLIENHYIYLFCKVIGFFASRGIAVTHINLFFGNNLSCHKLAVLSMLSKGFPVGSPCDIRN